jgi:hypothetical protein
MRKNIFMLDVVSHTPPLGRGKKLSDCKTLQELTAYTRRYRQVLREGKTDKMWVRCPHCRTKYDAQTTDGLILVPNRGDDSTAAPARVVDCSKCTRQFKAEAPAGWRWELWP